jgi:hypothetical protein
MSEVSFLVSGPLQDVVFVDQRLQLRYGFEQLLLELLAALALGLHAGQQPVEHLDAVLEVLVCGEGDFWVSLCYCV